MAQSLRHKCLTCAGHVVGVDTRIFVNHRMRQVPGAQPIEETVQIRVGLCNVCAQLFDFDPAFHMGVVMEALKKRGERVV